ncbi:Type IV pilus biogenesis protein PilO [hydrothermal vent metagenome]|uniref:Type IV pilus biogenesis protein PilO n=1 Tax=hydrothermal vent metagenome TaxID=652676 RepID=A0A3B1A5P6_9ZZZZ
MKDINLSEIDLDINNIGSWPMPIKIILIAVVSIGVLVGGYFLDLQSQNELLDRSRAKEITLKKEFEKKQAKAANLDAYKKQMVEMKESFGTMLRQLPSKTEVENLVDEITQTGLTSGVEFKLFKPETERFIEFYAEKPISIEIVGSYHQFGEFISGVAALPRIVTMHNINIKSSKAGELSLTAIAKTYRYLDEVELQTQAKKKRKKKKR